MGRVERPEGTVTGIGRTLAQARETRGLDLREVEAETKIRIKYLRALEAEEWSVLPGPAYAVGFLRTYATLLDLDDDELAAELRGALEDYVPAEQRHPAGEPVPAGRGRAGRPRRWLRLLGLFFVLLPMVAGVVVVVGLIAGEGSEPGEGSGPKGQGTDRSDAGSSASQESRGPMDLTLDLHDDVPVCLFGDGSPRPLIDNQVLGAGSEEQFTAERFELRFPEGFERSQLQVELDDRPVQLEPSLAPTAFKLERPGKARPTGAHAGACP